MDGIILNRLSKYIEELNNFVSKARNLNEINDENLEETKILAAKLKAILSRFTAELYQYFNLSKDPDPDTISSFTTDQLQGEEILAELEARLKSKVEQNSVPLKSDQASYSKLPDLHLPEFSGNLLDWHRFWDQFISNMNRRKLNDVDKLLYLKSSLKGDAARLIDGFDTTNQSYQIAVNTLKARYGKNDEIIYAHHNALRKINRAEKMEECKASRVT